MKKISIFLILLLILQVNAVYAKTDTVKVIVNYNLIKYNKKTGFPSKKNVPFKQTMKSIGCSIGYDKKKKVAIAVYDNTRLEFPLNKKYFYNNNRKIKLDEKSTIKKGLFYISFKPVMKELGFDVEFDKKTNILSASNYTEDEYVEYHTGSLKTLASEVLKGNVIYKNGKYYAVPDYVKKLSNIVTHYSGNDLNTSIYPEENNRYDFSEVDFDWVTVNNFDKIMVSTSDLNFDTSKLEKGYINGWVYLYAFYEDGITNTEIIYPLPDLTDEFIQSENNEGRFNGISIKRENGVTYFKVDDLKKNNIKY